ncbi:helix-turn-helix domain-containing protein [Luteimicrobium sp. DT211]|uniref:helix-turn-helix domain-containing protein n=1 Tax=Luteimicrobium sp. DT211 TaxID=3393412 RepID=UPI003CF87EE6
MSTSPDVDAAGPDAHTPAEVVADVLDDARDLDLATLKALSHPLRVRLWDLLVTAGPATSTTLARQTGESTGSTSYHLRQLAAHGLVEELPDRGTARERWWHAASGALRVRGTGDAYETPSGGEVVRAFGSQWASLRADSLERFHDRVIERVEPESWVDASVDATSFAYLTLDELDALSNELGAVLEKHAGAARSRDDRPSPSHRRIEVQIRAFPIVDPREEGATPRG